MRDVARIRIGNQTAASARSPLEPFEYAIRRQFDAFEWFPDRAPDGRGWSEADFTESARASIRREAEKHDIRLSVHGSWHANPLTAQGRERLACQAQFAADIGASVLVAHIFPADASAQFVEAVVSLAGLLGTLGIRLAIENTPAASPSLVNELFRWFERASVRGAVGLCLDIGHANLCADTRNDYLAYIDQLAAEVPLVHLHVHENWGDRDSHLPLFTGPSASNAGAVEGLVDRLARRGFSGSIILEQWPHPPALLDVARDTLARMIATRARQTLRSRNRRE